jgi:hypothetical protein
MRCPSFEKLVDYLDGRLGQADASAVAVHLETGCGRCMESRQWYEQVSAIAASDDSLEPPPWVLKRALRIFEAGRSKPRLVERLGRAVASLVWDSLAQPDLVGVRSMQTASRQLLYRAGDYSIDLQIAARDPSSAELLGQVLRESETTFESVTGIAIDLIREGRPIQSTTASKLGEFAIKGVEPGVYDLRLYLPEGSVDIERLPVIQSE